MIHKELALRYSGVLSALRLIKWYNMFILLLTLLSPLILSGHFLIFAFLFMINCSINHIFFKRICSYIEKLNTLFEEDGSDSFKSI